MIYLVGLGAGGAQELSEQALHALRRAPRVFVSHPTHPSARVLRTGRRRLRSVPYRA
jgi:precorrin-6B methylase 1